MHKENTSKFASEILAILIALALFCVLTCLWPLVFLVIPGILIAALRLLYIKTKKNKPEEPKVSDTPTNLPHPNTEQDVIRTAFGILQRRITEQVTARYPAARWIWDVPNAMEYFAENRPLEILLNRAGGFKKAKIQVFNLQFRGIAYQTVKPEKTEEPADDDAEDDLSSPGSPAEDSMAADYSMLAFEWVEGNMLNLNNLCQAAFASGVNVIRIPEKVLPVKESWDAICAELKRASFTGAAIQDDGIHASF